MCLIAFAYHVHPDFPLILAGNRDEFFQRDSSEAHFWPDHPHILAGRDNEQGGTWLGVDQAGRLAALTNFRQPDKTRYTRSRGHLTADFLKHQHSAMDYLAALENTVEHSPGTYAGFNLLLSDHTGLYYFSNRNGGKAQKLTPGIYALSNHLLDTPWPKVRQVRTGLSKIVTQPNGAGINADAVDAPSAASWSEIKTLFRNPDKAPQDQLPETGVPKEIESVLSAIFIEGAHYGTRATTLVALGKDGGVHFCEQNYGPEGITGPQICESFQMAPDL